MKNYAFIVFVSWLFVNCTPQPPAVIENRYIDTIQIDRHIRILSSDDFQGRKPCTPGEKLTVDYIETEFKTLGLEPGFGMSYKQEVPIIQIKSEVVDSVQVNNGVKSLHLVYGDDYVVYTSKNQDTVRLNTSEVVFAGYGIVAPEYGWDDYAGIDVKGKTVLVLVNDPGFGSGDSTKFKGETMTYYGRWTYKYEEAARQGAAAVFIIHEDLPAGYPWLVVKNSWNGTNLTLEADENQPTCEMQGWITRAAAIRLFELGNTDMIGFKEKSMQQSQPVTTLGVNMSLTLATQVERNISYNVAAKISGSNSPEEAIVYSGHWDHLGIGPEVDGDSIYNGAHDNGSGIAVLLELARVFSLKEIKPSRSILFLAVTAEEQGLLGSAYYVQNPSFKMSNTVANINMDGLAAYGVMRDFTIIGYGQSDLDELSAEIATTQNRYIWPDKEASKGYFFRSDHFNFAKMGVPALFGSGSYEALDGGIERIEEEKADYLSYRYHRPADEYALSNWRYAGVLQDANLYYALGEKLANNAEWPKWKENSEFKSVRENDRP